MEQTQEPTQSSSKLDDEETENLVNESQEQVVVHCGIKEDYKCSSELDDLDSKQVRFEENGENVSATGEEDTANHVDENLEEGKVEHSTTETDVPETNGVDDEEEEDTIDTPTNSAEDETEQQQETPTSELNEENKEDQEENPTTDNLADTTEESQRNSFAGSEVSEEAIPEEEENEKDIHFLQKESQYDRSSSFSSLSVNIGSTQQDSDSEFPISSRASPEGESFDRSIDNEENVEEDEGEVEDEELEENEDDSEQEDESKEDREARLVKQAHLDIALSLDTQEEPEDDEEKAAAREPTSEDDTVATADAGLETTEDKEDLEEEEKDTEEEPEEAETEVPEVFVSSGNKDNDEDFDVDEPHNGKQEETKPETVSKEDHGEHTKVKELGRIFQEKNPNSKALFPKELNTTSEKSPMNVRRFKEMFEHGEPLLSPAAYGTVPEEECTSPRPGIVKNLRDLFENPKNFEWNETAKSATVVN